MVVSSEVSTKYVTGRREIHYSSYEEFLADARELAAGDIRTLGNWSYAQILSHLAKSIHTMIDGGPIAFPRPIQWFMRLVMLKRFLNNSLPAGFQIPSSAQTLLPDEKSVEAALSDVRDAIDRLESTTDRAPHGGFGKLTIEQWDQFQLRHAELHMSFVVPQTG